MLFGLYVTLIYLTFKLFITNQLEVYQLFAKKSIKKPFLSRNHHKAYRQPKSKLLYSQVLAKKKLASLRALKK